MSRQRYGFGKKRRAMMASKKYPKPYEARCTKLPKRKVSSSLSSLLETGRKQTFKD